MLYGADSESGSVSPPHNAWKRGIRIGSARDGKVIVLHSRSVDDGVTYAMVDGKVVAKMADGSSRQAARSPPKAWRSMPQATSTAPKSARAKSRSTSRSRIRGAVVRS